MHHHRVNTDEAGMKTFGVGSLMFTFPLALLTYRYMMRHGYSSNKAAAAALVPASVCLGLGWTLLTRRAK